MATNARVTTPSTIVSFKKGSTLKAYIDGKTNIIKRFYMIVISDEKMYDVRNPSIVLCSPELELVLDRRPFIFQNLWKE